jgi:nucleotide-binding universal stress UspA family protein
MQTIAGYKNLLLATDGSKESNLAAAHAVYLAKTLGANLGVVYVVNTHDAQSLGVHFSEAVRELKQEAQQVIDEVLKAAKEAGATAEGVVAEGNPGRAIVQVAEDRGADLILMGATGKSGFQELLLGSVSGYVADHSKRPVLIVRG